MVMCRKQITLKEFFGLIQSLSFYQATLKARGESEVNGMMRDFAKEFQVTLGYTEDAECEDIPIQYEMFYQLYIFKK